MTIKKFLQTNYQSYPYLGPGDIDLLLALALHRSTEYLYKNPEKKLNRSNLLAFKKLLMRRRQGWSMAHLQKYAYFFGLKFIVGPNTLIPRPASEILVQTALDYLNKNKLKQPKIIDIGTGSGCLILSLAKSCPSPAKYYGLDISRSALKTARTNARKLGLKNYVKFLSSNLLQNMPPTPCDIVLANLPYLTKAQLHEPSISQEPKTALYGGVEGLDYYRRLLEQLPKYLAKKYLVLLEIDPGQANKISELIKSNPILGRSKIEIIKDLQGLDRLVKISL